MRVLILDDDEAIGRLVARVANLSGLRAVAVSDASSFEEHLRTAPPQAIMLDLQLGDTDGVEQMRVLAQQHYNGALVLMSGYDKRVLAMARGVAQSLGLTVDEVLEKPLDVQELGQMFERLLSSCKTFSPERLREAIANDELALDFQPVVSRHPNTLKKLEALLRWDHPVAGRIQPNDFLQSIETDVATIDALTYWVVDATVAAYKVLEELGVRVPLSVNISPQNLHDLMLPNRIEQSLREGGMPAQHLCLEVTENAAFKDPARSTEILSRMRLRGMQLSIDDFGAGYSSLKILRQMPFTEIKIDRSFVTDVTISRDSETIARCIINLAANMGLGCVAEGIETEETAVLLEKLGPCDLQGYHIARPMPVEAVPVWLADWQSGGEGVVPDSIYYTTSMPNPGLKTGPDEAAEGPSRPAQTEGGRPAVRLSPQQLAVMRLLSEGCSVKEIARRLTLGVGTVKVHLSLAYSALGARNRIEAVTRFLPLLERDYAVQPSKVTA